MHFTVFPPAHSRSGTPEIDIEMPLSPIQPAAVLETAAFPPTSLHRKQSTV
jgi:hypothetical protein